MFSPRNNRSPLPAAPFAIVLLSASLSVGCGAENTESPLPDTAPHTAKSEAPPESSTVDGDDAPQIFRCTPAVTLTLQERSGVGSTGWSFDAQQLVPTADAHMAISSTDCGARGRWVSLDGWDVSFCAQADVTDVSECASSSTPSIEIGGNDSNVAVGDGFWVMRDDVPVAFITLTERTDLEDDWYAQSPVDPFEVTLTVQPLS